MHEGVDQLTTLYPLCFFREHELRRPLKIGIREDIIAQHPELQPSVIVSALQNYTRCVPYWSTLKAARPGLTWTATSLARSRSRMSRLPR
jgi:sRNA-binding protein